MHPTASHSLPAKKIIVWGVVDLNSMKVLSTHDVGQDPDVLAFDTGLKRLYVSAESGTVSVFEERKARELRVPAHFHMPHAHTSTT
jgi:hypothetical protein